MQAREALAVSAAVVAAVTAIIGMALFSGLTPLTLFERTLLMQTIVGGLLTIQTVLNNKGLRKKFRKLLCFKTGFGAAGVAPEIIVMT